MVGTKKTENFKHFVTICPETDTVWPGWAKFKSLSIKRQFQILIYGYEPKYQKIKFIDRK